MPARGRGRGRGKRPAASQQPTTSASVEPPEPAESAEPAKTFTTKSPAKKRLKQQQPVHPAPTVEVSSSDAEPEMSDVEALPTVRKPKPKPQPEVGKAKAKTRPRQPTPSSSSDEADEADEADDDDDQGIYCEPSLQELSKTIMKVKGGVVKFNRQGLTKENETYAFAAIHAYPFLYDQSRKSFHNVDKKTDAWNEIGSQINKTGFAMQGWFKTIRTKFSRVKRIMTKVNPSGSPPKIVTVTPTEKYVWLNAPYLYKHIQQKSGADVVPLQRQDSVSSQSTIAASQQRKERESEVFQAEEMPVLEAEEPQPGTSSSTTTTKRPSTYMDELLALMREMQKSKPAAPTPPTPSPDRAQVAGDYITMNLRRLQKYPAAFSKYEREMAPTVINYINDAIADAEEKERTAEFIEDTICTTGSQLITQAVTGPLMSTGLTQFSTIDTSAIQSTSAITSPSFGDDLLL